MTAVADVRLAPACRRASALRQLALHGRPLQPLEEPALRCPRPGCPVGFAARLFAFFFEPARATLFEGSASWTLCRQSNTTSGRGAALPLRRPAV